MGLLRGASFPSAEVGKVPGELKPRRVVLRKMPHQRRLPRIPATGRVTLWLNPAQRDLFVHSPDTPKSLSHALHHAPVQKGKLTLRVTRDSLDALITVAAKFAPQTRGEDRALKTLLLYLESLEDRFTDEVEGNENPSDEN